MPAQRTLPWIAIFVCAFLLRLGVTAVFQGLDAPPDGDANPDQLDYEEFAFELAQGHGYRWTDGEPTARRAPGTSFMLLAAYVPFGRSFLAARILICAVSALACLFAGLFAARAFGRRTGFVAGTLLALDPQHFYYAMHFLSEVPFATLTAIGIAASLRGLRCERGGFGWDAAAGVAYGLATLTRPQLVLLLPIGLVLAALARRRASLHVGVQVLFMLVPIVPWVVRNQEVLGISNISSGGGVTFWGAHNDNAYAGDGSRGGWIAVDGLAPPEWHGLDEVQRDVVAWEEGLAWTRENRGKMPGLLANKVRRLFTPVVLLPNRVVERSFLAGWILTVPLATIGIFLAWRRDRTATWILLAHLAALLGTALVFFGQWRLRHSATPLFAIAAAVPIGALWEAWSRRRVPDVARSV